MSVLSLLVLWLSKLRMSKVQVDSATKHEIICKFLEWLSSVECGVQSVERRVQAADFNYAVVVNIFNRYYSGTWAYT